MITLDRHEKEIREVLRTLKTKSGSHSPSVTSLQAAIPNLKVTIDACYLSNPYATDLFFEHLEKELLATGRIRTVLESYPSANTIIAERLASHLNIEPNSLFIGNGSTEIIQAALEKFVQKKVLITLPTFSPYYEFVPTYASISFYELKKENQFVFDAKAYLAIIQKEKPDTIVLINPNNPDGGYIPSTTLRQLLEDLKEIPTVIVDESFIHFAAENENLDFVSTVPLLTQYPNLVVIKSMSKDFGIAGIRAGYAVMNPKRVSNLLQRGYLWNVSGLAEYFFDLYARPDFLKAYEEVRVKYIQETKEFFEQLKLIPGITVYPSTANFALIELPNGLSAEDVTVALLTRYGIYSRNCADKKGLPGEFIRLAARTKAENKQILTALKAIL
jgi:histidinol-phosphate/aromatic aminotransferase/cobyric acid decarboxylase-like protein